MTRDEYVELLKSAALDAGTKLVMSYLVSRIPFFALKFINPIVGYVVGAILRIAIRETEFGAFFLFIDMRTDLQAKAFEEAAIKNANAKTPEEKKDAQDNLVLKFREFVKLRN